MRLARVVGNVISTIKDDGFNGHKIMIVEYFDPVSLRPSGPRVIAFDCADSGVGDIVLVNTYGSAGNLLFDDDYGIFDLVICGVVDSFSVYGKSTLIHHGAMTSYPDDRKQDANT